MATCSVDGCDKCAEKRGWCSMHYKRWKRHGNPAILVHLPQQGLLCEVDGCDSSAFSNGRCRLHDQRMRAGRTEQGPRYYLSPAQAAINNVKTNYQYRARCKGIIWDLSDDQFDKLICSVCFYCGAPPGNKENGKRASIMYSGIDRVDNTEGYIEGNVVSCCRWCNRAKDIRGCDEFLDHCSKIVAYQNETVCA